MSLLSALGRHEPLATPPLRAPHKATPAGDNDVSDPDDMSQAQLAAFVAANQLAHPLCMTSPHFWPYSIRKAPDPQNFVDALVAFWVAKSRGKGSARFHEIVGNYKPLINGLVSRDHIPGDVAWLRVMYNRFMAVYVSLELDATAAANITAKYENKERAPDFKQDIEKLKKEHTIRVNAANQAKVLAAAASKTSSGSPGGGQSGGGKRGGSKRGPKKDEKKQEQGDAASAGAATGANSTGGAKPAPTGQGQGFRGGPGS